MSYSNGVLIGDWSEERLRNEYEFKIFLRKRERKELLLQKSRTLFSNLLSERPLSISGTHVMFGYNVQLVASDMLGNKILGRTLPRRKFKSGPNKLVKAEGALQLKKSKS